VAQSIRVRRSKSSIEFRQRPDHVLTVFTDAEGPASATLDLERLSGEALRSLL
jgi:hypothetical protein